MKITYLNPEKENWFLVTWDISNKCNYRCSYCPDFLHDGSSGWPDFEKVTRFVDTLNEQYPDKKICFRFSGGEPTYWKRFDELGKYIKAKGNYFSFLTNGSQTVEYFQNIKDHTDGVIISYHSEFAETQHIIDVANTLSCPVSINLMLVPEKFDTVVGIAKQIYENSNAAIWPKVILTKTGDLGLTNEPKTYTEEQQHLIKHWPYFRKLDETKIHRGGIALNDKPITANEIILMGLNKYSGWKCYGGIDSLHVSAWGEVYRSDCKQNKIGHIDDFIRPTEPTVCSKQICGCLSDLYLRKELEI